MLLIHFGGLEVAVDPAEELDCRGSKSEGHPDSLFKRLKLSVH